jgi:hypothetical protein
VYVTGSIMGSFSPIIHAAPIFVVDRLSVPAEQVHSFFSNRLGGRKITSRVKGLQTSEPQQSRNDETPLNDIRCVFIAGQRNSTRDRSVIAKTSHESLAYRYHSYGEDRKGFFYHLNEAV